MKKNFDNMDGKQARKTNSSSPLGLLLDHSFDSLTTVLHAVSFSQSFLLGNNFNSVVLVLVGGLQFYFVTQEEFPQ